MVKVNYASLQTQSSTMSSVSQSRVAGFNQLLSAFNSFGDSGNELIGTGYDAARVYATSVMSPYYKGFILYSEAVADAANTLADNYVAKCGAENLDEEQLQAEIHHATSACISLGNSIVRLESVKQTETIKTRLNNLRNQYDAAQSQLTVAQEKLDKLLAFSAESLLACTSADTYQLLIYQAMSGISTSFGGGSFALPQDLSWVGDVEQGWADREIAMENNYLSALEKVNNGESLTESELTAIERYAAAYPDSVDASVLEYVQQARQVKAEEMKYRSIIDKVDAGEGLTDEEIKIVTKKIENYPNIPVNKISINKIIAKNISLKAYQKIQNKIKNNQILTDKDKKIIALYWRTHPEEAVNEYNKLKKKVYSKEFFEIGKEGYTFADMILIATYLANHPYERNNLNEDINYGIVMTQAYDEYHARGDNPDYSPFNAGTGRYHDIIKKTGRYPDGQKADEINQWVADHDAMKYLTLTQEILKTYSTVVGSVKMSREAHINGVSPNYTQNNGLLNVNDYLEIIQGAKENPNESEIDKLLNSLEYLEKTN